jgi:hypothetical protein
MLIVMVKLAAIVQLHLTVSTNVQIVDYQQPKREKVLLLQ